MKKGLSQFVMSLVSLLLIRGSSWAVDPVMTDLIPDFLFRRKVTYSRKT